MRTFLPLCITFVFAALVATESQAQISPRGRSVRQTERVARASWQPTRSQPPRSSQQEPQNRLRSGSVQTPGSVRTVQAVSEGVPMPPPDTSVSVVEDAGSALVPQPEVLDGQIQLAPVYGGAACDALPVGVGGCGCGDSLCDGCDSLGACDSCGDLCGGSCCGELCSVDAWRPCITLCVPQDGWVLFEALGWKQDGMYLPPLVTTSVDPDVSRNEAGVLTSPSTRVLLGGGKYLGDSVDGGRLRFGVWLDRCHTWGLGAEYIGVSTLTRTFAASSDGDPILARPFFNTEIGTQDSELVAFPGVIAGTVSVSGRSEFQGGAFHVHRLRRTAEGCRKWLFCGCKEHFCTRTELLFGYRYLQLDESVIIGESLNSLDSSAPGTFDIADGFRSVNQFNGIDVGYKFRCTRGFWTFDALVRLGIGNTSQKISIAGATRINDPGSNPTVATYPGGLLTQTSNIGEYKQNQFAVVPEMGFTFGYQLTERLRLTLGYTGIYWSNVARAGDHISLDVNENLIPPPETPFSGALRPAFKWDTNDYWIQGVNLGGEFRW